MVLDTLSHVLAPRVSTRSVTASILGIATLSAINSWSKGYVCEEDRNVHNKTFILVGCCSGAGLELFRSLAARGAQVIALHPDPSSPQILQLLLLLRSSTGNERLYAEECNIHNAASLRSFAKRWEKDGRSGMVQDLEARIDGIVFCDGEGSGLESTGRGVRQQLVSTDEIDDDPIDVYHSAYVIARHALVQLLLPALLRSASTSSTPIRIIHQVSPFYSTIPQLRLDDLNWSTRPYPSGSPWLAEGQASLASVVLAKESQLRLADKSNVAFISVCSGFTRRYVNDSLLHSSTTWLGFLLSWLLWPLIWSFCKSSQAASQILLAAVLAPVAGRNVPNVDGDQDGAATAEQATGEDGSTARGVKRDEKKRKVALRGGALYREGLEVLVPALQTAPATLGSDLWDLESATVQRFMKRAEAAEKVEGDAKKSSTKAT